MGISVRSAEELIRRFLDSIGSGEGEEYVRLFSSWREIVSDRIADHAQPVDLKGRTLVVEADHPGWIQMVMMERTRIVDELQRRFPELNIDGISVRTASMRNQETKRRPSSASDSQEAQQEQPARPPSRDEKEALSRIEDDEMRETLERLRTEIDE